MRGTYKITEYTQPYKNIKNIPKSRRNKVKIFLMQFLKTALELELNLNCDDLVLQGQLTLTSRKPTADKVPSLAQSFQLPASCLCGRESLMSENPMPHSCGM